MNRPIIFMYSGQGSQYYQMGKALFEKNETFKKAMISVDLLCQDLIQTSIIEILYQNNSKKSDIFNRTLFSHPAIFMVEYALTQVLVNDYKLLPDYVLGTSVGEFAAAVAANVLDFRTAVESVIKQAEYIENYAEKSGMLAIVYDQRLFYQENDLFESAECAAINFSNHFIISGSLHQLDRIRDHLKKRKILFQYLPVSYGFHSACIDGAAPYYLNYIKDIKTNIPQIKFISCMEANINLLIEPSHFWDCVRYPILFEKTIKKLESELESMTYVDIGPSGTLATFIKYNLSKTSRSQAITILSPYQDNINLDEILECN